jgi:hypothetical protein
MTPQERHKPSLVINDWHEHNKGTGDELPVFFSGIEGLRLLGTAKSYSGCDNLLFANRLSATYLSTAEAKNTGNRAYIAHS